MYKSGGGWRGPRRFRVVRKEPESSIITSFYLEPVNGGEIMGFQPGQFITVLLEVAGQRSRRTYSLSGGAGSNHYRISVKSEPEVSVKSEPEGIASNHLHDHVQVGTELDLLPPSGEFTLTENPRPLALLTAGVGITPAISMLDAAASSGRDIHFIHYALNSRVHAFRDHVDTLAIENENIQPHYIYSDPLPDDRADFEGFIDEEKLTRLLPEDRDVDLYFLGPKPFMELSARMTLHCKRTKKSLP
ncbi:FAD-binding oxidoreductase [Marinobacter subterrani]|uniref:FAD-binding oxidoreductase n=1 Tax=Marinobacter subterrani TaxID=1658765 RepID=UPI00235518D5|nr:FAD-binding oxidoreductase [Marinobacter subterrani]